VARNRIAGIVENQHRSSYDKAATLAFACAEVFHRRGQADKAQRFLDEVSEKFPRHRTFQSEFQAARLRSQRGKK
jgi:hypothetical protein